MKGLKFVEAQVVVLVAVALVEGTAVSVLEAEAWQHSKVTLAYW